MDKILVSMGSGEHTQKAITVTNDGATILQQLEVEHPAAKVRTRAASVSTEIGSPAPAV